MQKCVLVFELCKMYNKETKENGEERYEERRTKADFIRIG
jgi:hypothetical protein